MSRLWEGATMLSRSISNLRVQVKINMAKITHIEGLKGKTLCGRGGKSPDLIPAPSEASPPSDRHLDIVGELINLPRMSLLPELWAENHQVCHACAVRLRGGQRFRERNLQKSWQDAHTLRQRKNNHLPSVEDLRRWVEENLLSAEWAKENFAKVREQSSRETADQTSILLVSDCGPGDQSGYVQVIHRGEGAPLEVAFWCPAIPEIRFTCEDMSPQALAAGWEKNRASMSKTYREILRRLESL